MPRGKAFQEEEVLKRAMELFWKQGYHATSMQELVDYLGINRASLYNTFGGKRALFEQALNLYREANGRIMLRLLHSKTDVREGLRHLFMGAIQGALADKDKKGCMVVNSCTELLPHDAALQKVLMQNQTNLENTFYAYLLDGQKRGQIPEGKDLTAMASLLFTFYNGIKVVSKLSPSQEELIQQLNLVLSLLD